MIDEHTVRASRIPLAGLRGGLATLIVAAPILAWRMAKRGGEMQPGHRPDAGALRSPAEAMTGIVRGMPVAPGAHPLPNAAATATWPACAASPSDPASWGAVSTDHRPPFGDYQAHRWPYPCT